MYILYYTENYINTEIFKFFILYNYLLYCKNYQEGCMKQKKKTGKTELLIFFVVVLLIACTSIALSTINSTDNMTYELRGIIKDATMNTLTVQGEDEFEYHFNTENIHISTEKTGLIIGNSVTITYRGKLALNVSTQKVEILSITVTDRDSENDIAPPDETEITETNTTTVATQKAQEILSNMTLEEKVGQMFIVRCPETETVQKVKEYYFGGYLLFGRDFLNKTKDEIVQTIQSYQSVTNIPMFIGVDEEGGPVNRISTNPNLRSVPFYSSQELYAEGGFDLIKSDTHEKCELLHSLGINLNFAPVCDISQDPDDFIYERSFGKDALQTSAYVQFVVQTMSEERMGSVLKHFPGYGNNVDTHTGIAYDNRSYETFINSDFLPFQAGIDSGANIILISHNVVSCIDNQNPASLSLEVHRILREDLKFSGVIITDDLAMEGIRDFAEDADIAVQAVLAGNDLLCCTDFEVQIPAVIEAVKQGKITEERINESVLRILELKISLGIIE